MKELFEKFKSRLPYYESYVAPSNKTFIIASLAVLLSCLGITAWAWRNAQTRLSKEVDTTLQTGMTAAQTGIQTAVGRYGEVLTGGAALFKVNSDISQSDWDYYYSSFDLKTKYPGLQAIVYNEVITKDQLNAYEDNARRESNELFAVRPSGERDAYAPAKFLSPYNDENKEILGYDPLSDELRKKPMETARDSGQLSVSDKVTLIQDQEQGQVPGVILFLPIYKTGLPLSTIEERRQALQGYASAGIRTTELIQALFGSSLNNETTGFAVYDGTSAEQSQMLYESPSFDRLRKDPSTYTSTRSARVGNHPWTLVAYVQEGFAPQAQQRLPRTILIVGTLLSFLFSAFLLTLMITRARAIAYEKHSEVQEVKDELLSLASHQLRTPATSVKQYIGMVLEGFAGKVSKDQRQMLEKAYHGNERQLEIINQILYVTRADAGRLLINKERLELNKLIKDIVDEQGPSIRTRKQKTTFKSSAKQVYIKADQQYLTMAFDNLINNASKYSYQRTKIDIRIHQHIDSVDVIITDHGVGIDPKDQSKLFQKFSRIHNPLSIEAGGSGIGLYLCKEIIQLHRGTITVESAAGKGATFIINLPKK